MPQEEIKITTDRNEKITHLLTEEEQWAINAAIAANRPLLVEGEPGTGKTQLAVAAAKWLKRRLVSMTVDSKSEASDALWRFDAVQRLAHAQMLATFRSNSEDRNSPTQFRQLVETELAVGRFVRPGPMWWALSWDTAKTQLNSNELPSVEPDEEWDEETGGVVVLIDEIDKADRDFPNGLLEVFGSRRFTPPGSIDPIEANKLREPPFMIITTNNERDLPSAFERRCLKFRLDPPPVLNPKGQPLSNEDVEAFLNYLITRGKLHFPKLNEKTARMAAVKIMEFRIDSLKKHEPQKSGLAEYIDLLRTLSGINSEPAESVLEKVGKLFRK